MDYSILQKKMEIRRNELLDKIARIKTDLSKAHSSDWPDQAQERENDEVLNQLGDQSEQELIEINAALERIKNHVYGKCTRCSNEISIERLEIKPEASYCVKCAA